MLTGCTQKAATTPPQNEDTSANHSSFAPIEVVETLGLDKAVSVPQKLKDSDFVTMWWPDGLRDRKEILYMSGNYGAAWDVNTLQLTRLSSIAGASQILPLERSDAVMGLEPLETTISADGVTLSGTGSSAIIYSGQFCQKTSVFGIQGPDSVLLEMSVTGTPTHLVVNISQTAGADTSIRILQSLPADYVLAGQNNGAFTLCGADGSGLTVLSPNAVISVADHGFAAEATRTLTLVLIPSQQASCQDADNYLAAQTATVCYGYLDQDQKQTAKQTASFDMETGNWTIIMMPSADLNYDQALNRAALKMTQFTITNPNDRPIRVPVCFSNGDAPNPDVTGGVPIIRDLDGNPIGLAVQASKNWHGTEKWIAYFTIITVPANTTVGYELTVPTAQWGGAYSASCEQLCLNGYFGKDNQLWIEAALGCFGESITFDPDVNLGRSVINDFRPFQIDSWKGRWGWTGNIGGADFLKYSEAKNIRACMKNVTTDFVSHGPCLTDVRFYGESFDDKISCEIQTHLCRTDDVVRNYFELSYLFNCDTEFSRLGVFQMAADGYNDNQFQKFAWGVGSAVLADETKTKAGTIITGSDNGDLWCMCYDSSDQVEENGNTMFVVREYRFTDGATGQVTRIPTLKLRGYQSTFELTLPEYILDQECVPAGSTLEAVVELLALPAGRASYYGESEYLMAMTQDTMNSTEMAIIQAEQGALSAEAIIGNLEKIYPTTIQMENGQAQLRLTGGIGYTPIVFTNLDTYSGWVLQESSDGKHWEIVDQSSAFLYGTTETSDFWQCEYDADSDTYRLTFNVENHGTKEYRLVKTDSQ